MDRQIKQKFLQTLMFQPTSKIQDAVEKLSLLAERKMTVDEMEQLVERLNRDLSQYYQKIQHVTCDITGDRYLVFINTVSNPLTMSIPTYSPSEMNMFNLIIAELIGAETIGFVSTINILNLNSKLSPPISKTEAQQILQKLVKEQWLYTKNGNVYFGVRSAAELIPYLRENYRDFVYICSLCKSEALTAVSCNKDECAVVLHYQCLKRLKEKHPTSYQCPGCGQRNTFD